MEEHFNQLYSDTNAICSMVFRIKHIYSLLKDVDNTDEMKEAYKRIISELIQITNEKIEALYEKYSK